jgi:hypothetical protein
VKKGRSRKARPCESGTSRSKCRADRTATSDPAGPVSREGPRGGWCHRH